MPSVKPRFNKNLPRNWMDYFSPIADEKFKKEHPAAYRFLVFLAMVAILVPMIVLVLIFLALGVELNSTKTSYILLLCFGLIGSFSLSVGLFNIVAAFIHQYMGHKVTLISIIAGLCIWAIVIALLLTL